MSQALTAKQILDAIITADTAPDSFILMSTPKVFIGNWLHHFALLTGRQVSSYRGLLVRREHVLLRN